MSTQFEERISWQWGVVLNPPETELGGIAPWDPDEMFGVTATYDLTKDEAVNAMGLVCDVLDRLDSDGLPEEWTCVGEIQGEDAAKAAEELLNICGRVPRGARFTLAVRRCGEEARP